MVTQSGFHRLQFHMSRQDCRTSCIVSNKRDSRLYLEALACAGAAAESTSALGLEDTFPSYLPPR